MPGKLIPVDMIRASLDDLPVHPLPEPYRIRWYREGDEQTWLRIQGVADEYDDITAAMFERGFGEDRAALPQRQAFLCDADGVEIGTASAWFDNGYRGERWGRVHWVAIVPECQGRGLSKPLLAAVCNRLKELGHVRATLDTQTVRLRAIRVYLSFGFVPDIRTDASRQAWEAVAEELRAVTPDVDWDEILRA